ncbi:hypothetical protein [Bradyrhizobium phage BDU-MI-1]|nr:hypothetical protein [Bradyrhizobium phage BDU-MI-1]
MPVREFINAYTSGRGYDDGENDVVVLFLNGPRGGTLSTGHLSAIQARDLRDNLDLALTRMADARARIPVYVVVDNAGYEGEKDLFEARTFDEAAQWRRDNYDGDVIAERHIEIARDIAGERSYEL